MDWYVRAFLKSSLAWLGAGVTLGLAMAVWPGLVVYRPAHVHFNLLGFVAMMIFGVGYQMLPRMAGHPLRYPALAKAHWVLANLGLLLLGVGFALAPHGRPGLALALRATGGVCAAAGAYLFIYNVWRSINAGTVRRERLEAERSRRAEWEPAPRRELPVLQEQ